MSNQDFEDVSPALKRYQEEVIEKGLWQRPGLSRRDRSLVTVAALASRGASPALTTNLELAIENGVKPGELSELLTHLAFYAGWGEASQMAPLLKKVFESQDVKASSLPAAAPQLLPIDEEAEAKRAETVAQNVGPVSKGLDQDTADVLFRDLWLRPDLTPRDRSLVTVCTLITTGQPEQIKFHLDKAMNNGLSQEEASEVLSHLAYYAGWAKTMSAVSVFKSVFEGQAQ